MNDRVLKFDNLKIFISKFNLSPRQDKYIQKILEKTELENVVKLSTSALLMEERPANLPPKTIEDSLKHQKEFEEMTKLSREYFKKEAIRTIENMNKEKQREEVISESSNFWRDSVIPNWDTMKNIDQIKKNWWNGLPSCVRGDVWFLCYGKKFSSIDYYLISLAKCSSEYKFAYALLSNFFNELSLLKHRSVNTDGFLNPALSKNSSTTSASSSIAIEIFDCNQNSTSSVSVFDKQTDILSSIDLDVERTFPNLKLFQLGAPFYNQMRVLLAAFALCRPEIGYVQGLSFIAAVVLINMEWLSAVQTMLGIISLPLMSTLYTFNESKLQFYFSGFEKFLENTLPSVARHFKSENFTPNIYLIEWLFTIYSKALPLDIASRVWDMFCRDGEEFLFLVALGIFNIFQINLPCMNFFTLAQFLNHLPESLTSEQLFDSIDNLSIKASTIAKYFKRGSFSFALF